MFSQAIDSPQPQNHQNTLRDLLTWIWFFLKILHIIFEISRPFFAGGKNEQHEQWVYKSCFNVHPCQQSHIYDECICFCHIHCHLFFMVGGNLLKNGLFYFRPHNWVSKNIQRGQRGTNCSIISIIANYLVALYLTIVCL